VKFFTIISFFILSVSPVLSEENIKNSIESDEIEYLNETDKLKALGSVKITREKTINLRLMRSHLIKKITLSKVLEMLLSKKKVDQLF